MKKAISTGIFILLMLSGTFAVAEPVKLKLSVLLPPKSGPLKNAITPWVEKMNQASERTMEIEIYPGGVLGRDPRVQYKLVITGVADMALVLPAYTPGRFPDDVVFDLPLLADNGVDAAVASQSMFEKGLLGGYDEIKVLGHFTTGVYYVSTSFPAKTPQDLKGHKLRVVNKVQADMLKEFDAIGVGMPITKVAENLSRGVIEGIIGDLSILFDFRLDEVAKNHLFVPMGVTSVLIVMNKQKYESLPAKAKAAIDKHGSEIVRMFAETVEADNLKGLEKIKSDPKHTIVRPTADELKQWERVIQPVMETWKTENPKLEKLITIYREELEKAKRKR